MDIAFFSFHGWEDAGLWKLSTLPLLTQLHETTEKFLSQEEYEDKV